MSYQSIVDYQRRRHILGGYGWPGRPVGAPAVSQYPNIVVELNASCCWLYLPAEFARVSQEIMAAVIEANEKLSPFELYKLTACWQCDAGYLQSPVLQIVDPTTNKGKRRRRYLFDLLQQANGLEITGVGAKVIDRVRDALERNRPVTYGGYRWACRFIEEAIAEAEPKCVRTTRWFTA